MDGTLIDMTSSKIDRSVEARRICSIAPVIPVLVVEDINKAKPLAEALVKGGLSVLEVTLRTDAALDCIREMSKVPSAVVGAGTLLDPEDAVAVKAAGAQFGVSPGATDELLDACEDLELPMLPGASTLSEIMRLKSRGYNMLKFFPAEAAGGIPMLKSIGAPIPQVSFCPTGGISPQSAPNYLALNNVVCVGGSWVTPSDLVAAENWTEIEALASQASGLRS